jgi:predicted O-methyltransferase YrrM
MRRVKIKHVILSRLNALKFSNSFSRLILPFLRTETYLDLWVVRPMNGQKNRLRTAYLLSNILDPTHAIETGGFLGTTTQYLSSMVREKTFSIEINQDFLDVAQKRLHSEISSGSVEFVHGDSSIALSEILQNLNSSNTRILAYLDAHWLDHFPLREEVSALLHWGGVFVAIVDDFRIPDDSGYGFDSYPNSEIDISHIPKTDDLTVWVPLDSSTLESGARRGTAFLIHKNLLPQVESNKSNLRIRRFEPGVQ